METPVLTGSKIKLVPCKNGSWHEFYKNYVSDPMMDPTPYEYNYSDCENAFHRKTNDNTRQYFSIIRENNVVGEIYLKHMDKENKTTEFGIALTNDSVKGNGYGSQAIQLLVDYVFSVLMLDKITACSVIRNVRSQHILNKVGFVFSHEDSKFKHYILNKNCAK